MNTYRLVAYNKCSKKRTYLTSSPITLKEAKTMLSKFSVRLQRVIAIERFIDQTKLYEWNGKKCIVIDDYYRPSSGRTITIQAMGYTKPEGCWIYSRMSMPDKAFLRDAKEVS